MKRLLLVMGMVGCGRSEQAKISEESGETKPAQKQPSNKTVQNVQQYTTNRNNLFA